MRESVAAKQPLLFSLNVPTNIPFTTAKSLYSTLSLSVYLQDLYGHSHSIYNVPYQALGHHITRHTCPQETSALARTDFEISCKNLGIMHF